MRRNLPILALYAMACPSPGYVGAAWNAATVVATDNTVYVPLNGPGSVAAIQTDGSVSYLDDGGWRTDDIQVAPGGDRVLFWQSGYRCEESSSKRPPETIDDCDGDLVAAGRLVVRDESGVIATTPLDPVFAEAVFSDDGAWGVARIDKDRATQQALGVINLDALILINLETGAITQLPVGFETTGVYFLPDAAGAASGLLLLSPSKVATVSLGDAPTVDVVFPLTLSVSDVVHPVGAALTADGSHALITVAESSDLYTLDLVNPSINLVALSGRPSAMYADPSQDRSFVVYSNRSVVDVIDHSTFAVTHVALDGAMRNIDRAGSALILTGDSTLGYRLDLASGELVEIGLRARPVQRWISGDGSWLLTSSGGTDLEVASIGPDTADADAITSRALALRSGIVSASFTTRESAPAVRLLLSGVDEVFTLDLATLAVETTEVAGGALALGSVGDDKVWIAQNDALGLLSFLSGDNTIVTASGFAAENMDRPQLLIPSSED